MTEPWVAIGIKVLATALAVTLAARVAESAGPIWGALAASLPVSIGPTYVFLVLAHDTQFISESALSSFAGNAATMLFLLSYVQFSRRVRGALALIGAISIWVAAALLIEVWRPSSVAATALNAVCFTAGLSGSGSWPRLPPAPPIVFQRRWSDLPLRASIVGIFVGVILVLSNVLGPSATGVLAVFPVVFVLLIGLLTSRIGEHACAVLAATALRAMGGFGLMLLVLSLTVVPLGPAASLSLALATTLTWSAMMVYARRWG